jgi:hypothetical protein
MKGGLVAVLELTAALNPAGACAAKTVSLPVQIDYRLLESLAAAG